MERLSLPNDVDIREVKTGDHLRLTPYGARWTVAKVTESLVILSGPMKTKYLLRNEARMVYEVTNSKWEF